MVHDSPNTNSYTGDEKDCEDHEARFEDTAIVVHFALYDAEAEVDKGWQTKRISYADYYPRSERKVVCHDNSPDTQNPEDSGPNSAQRKNAVRAGKETGNVGQSDSFAIIDEEQV